MRAASAAALALAVALAAAAAASAGTTDPRSRLTKVGEAHARAVLLRFSDLGPAWTGGAEKPSSLKIPVCPGDQPNDSDLTLIGHAESYLQLKSEGLAVDTDVEVFASAAQVNTLFRRMLNSRLPSCLQYDLQKSLGSTGIRIGSVSKLGLKAVGSHSSGYRVHVTDDGHPVVSDYLFVARGDTQCFVNVVAPGALASQLLPLEDRIAARLARRAV